MAIWTKPISTEILTTTHIDTAADRLGIEFVEIGPDFIRGRIPVDERTRQPYGVIHGGANVVLAETLGSCGADYSTPIGHRIVGLDINANHIRGVPSGWVNGIARPAGKVVGAIGSGERRPQFLGGSAHAFQRSAESEVASSRRDKRVVSVRVTFP